MVEDTQEPHKICSLPKAQLVLRHNLITSRNDNDNLKIHARPICFVFLYKYYKILYLHTTHHFKAVLSQMQQATVTLNYIMANA